MSRWPVWKTGRMKRAEAAERQRLRLEAERAAWEKQRMRQLKLAIIIGLCIPVVMIAGALVWRFMAGGF